MPVTFRILPQINLLHVAYAGCAGLAETVQLAADCAAHPDFRSSLRHLIDLGAVTDFERDVPGYFAMQARVIELFPVVGEGFQSLTMVVIAPPGPPRQMAEMVRRSWDGLDGAIVRIVEDEAAALSVLGLPADALAGQPVWGRPGGG
jgi:hypothetical protein